MNDASNAGKSAGRVLILDDEKLVRFTISAWLKTTGFEPVAVATPEEAIAALRDSVFDAVVSDVMLGAMDGFMFRDLVRKFNAEIPFIFLTSLVSGPSNGLMDRVIEDIHSYYVPKNSKREYLLGKLRQVVSSFRSESSMRELERRHDANMRLASQVQRSLLPYWCFFGDRGFYSGMWRPCEIISGDFCDWCQLPDDKALFVFGDISGHGVSAALAMMSVEAHIKMLFAKGGELLTKPYLFCKTLDRFIKNNLQDVAYMSGLVAYIDFANGTVRYCNAGSADPCCVKRTDGTIIDMNPGKLGCLPLGMTDNATFNESDEVTCVIPDDGVICFYSDGFIDLSQDEQGEERLPKEMFFEMLSGLVSGADGVADVGSVPYRLIGMLQDMGYTHVQDDMTFVVLGRNTGKDGRFLRSIRLDDPTRLDRVIARVSDWAVHNGVSEETRVKLELLLDEHLENIRSHGLDDYGRRKEVVALEVRKAQNGVEVLTWDRGQPWKVDLTEVAPHPDVMLDARNRELASSGRGIAILRKIASRINYDVFGNLNRITFFIPEAGAALDAKE